MVELQGRGPSTRRVWRPSALGSSAARPGPREPPPQGSHSMQGREGTISCPPGNSAPSWSTGAGSALSSGQPGRGGHRVKEGSKDPNLPPPPASPRLDSRGRRTRRARAPEFHLTTLRLSCPFLASAGGGTGSLQGRSKRLSLGSFRDNLGKVCVWRRGGGWNCCHLQSPSEPRETRSRFSSLPLFSPHSLPGSLSKWK